MPFNLAAYFVCVLKVFNLLLNFNTFFRGQPKAANQEISVFVFGLAGKKIAPTFVAVYLKSPLSVLITTLVASGCGVSLFLLCVS